MNILNKRQKRLILAEEVFYFFSSLLFVFVVMELIFPRIILVYFNINILLVLVIASGINLLLSQK